MSNLIVNFHDALVILSGIVKDFGPSHIGRNENAACYFQPNGSTNDEPWATQAPDAYNLVPFCIVGQAFHRLGISRALLNDSSDRYSQASTCTPGDGLWDRAEVMGVTFNEDAQRLFRAVQSQQDNNVPWGRAVELGVETCQEDAKSHLPQFSWQVDNLLRDLPKAEV